MIPKKLSVKTAFKLLIFNWTKKILGLNFHESYSQIGEDIVISHMLRDLNIKEGVYVDVGCNHPIRCSNTFKLYLNGWTGITIDLNNSLMDEHRKERKQDVQVQAAVSDSVEDVTIYEFNSNLVTTIDPVFKEELEERFHLITENKTTKTQTLNQILSEQSVQKIDLLCIDVEGHDFNVLRSIDLEIYKPKIIVIEMHDFNFEDMKNHKIFAYLIERNYKFEGFLIANGFFILH